MTQGGLKARSLAIALAVALLSSALPMTAGAVDIDGYVEEQFAHGVADRDEIMFHRQTLKGELEHDLSDSVSLRIEGDAWMDSADFIDGTDFSGRLREAYLKFGFDNFDVRIGRQRIAWGEADGVVVSDQVSPFDLTNFIVPQFDSIRLGVDGATVDYYFSDGSDLQLIWISHFQNPNFPELDSPWTFFDPEFLEDNNITVGPRDEPSERLENSEFGARYSRHPTWADWSIGYLHTYSDRPAPRLRDITIGPNGIQATLIPTHDAFDLFTFNFTAPVGDYLFRVDQAYERGRFLSTAPMSVATPPTPAQLETLGAGFAARHDVWRSLIGVDTKPQIPFWEQADASFQYIHEQVIDAHPALAEAEEVDLVSVLLRAAYRNETIKPWVFAIYDLRGANSWVQLKVDYEPVDNWRFSLEYDHFAGHAYNPATRSGGNFGMFDDNDFVSASIRRSF